MERFYGKQCEPEKMNALNLAFIGDCVFDLYVRERLLCLSDTTVNKLHGEASKVVCCMAQAEDAKLFLPIFTEEETKIFLRGRNAHPGHLPKNASPADYHAATGVEAVFGYLYLKGNIERLRYFFSLIFKED